MKAPTIDREIRARIDSFLGELTDLVRQSALDAIHGALGAGTTAAAAVTAATKRGPGRPRKSGAPSPIAPPKARRGKRGKRTPEDVLETAATVLAYIKAHAGERLEQIGKGLGVATKGLKLPIQKLFEQKAIKTKGEKRGTRYFAAGSNGGGPVKKAKAAKRHSKTAATRRAAKRGGRRAAKAKAVATPVSAGSAPTEATSAPKAA